MRKPAVLQITKYYAPSVGGIERIVQDIAEGLGDDFAMRVLACSEGPFSGADAPWNGVPVTRTAVQAVAFRLPLSFRFYSAYARLSRQADLLQFHLPFPLADAAALLSGLGGRRSVAWYHSDVVRQSWALSLYGPLLRRFLRQVDRILVASPGLLESSPHLASFKDKCRLVPYGVASDLPEEEDVDLPAGAFVLFVGRLVGYKGVPFLLEAMRGVDAPLVVAGDGPERAALRDRAEALGLAGRVRFVGALSRPRLQHCLRRCRVLALPSVTRSEAFGMVQLEAMIHGKPVVNTHLDTGVPGVSLHGVSGLTVPPRDPAALADALRTLLRDEAAYAALSRGAAARARDFSMARFLDGVRRTYGELLAT